MVGNEIYSEVSSPQHPLWDKTVVAVAVWCNDNDDVLYWDGKRIYEIHLSYHYESSSHYPSCTAYNSIEKFISLK